MNNEPRWYVLGDDGSAMLCVGEEDAREHVHFCNVEHPLTAPHRAAQLVEADELDRLRARVAELERDRMHAGVDICEVAAAVEIVRAQEVVKAVEALADGYHDGPFRHGFETACEEIAHRLRPCEHCDTALAKDGA